MKTALIFILCIETGHSAVALEFPTKELCEAAGHTITETPKTYAYRWQCIGVVK